jgi:cytochrome c-type biogenesis protein CcmH/NrfG
MTDRQLAQQFTRCQQWNDPDQWDVLAHLYFAKGYVLNAAECFRKADEIRGCAFAEAATGAYAEYVEA